MHRHIHTYIGTYICNSNARAYFFHFNLQVGPAQTITIIVITSESGAFLMSYAAHGTHVTLWYLILHFQLNDVLG